MKKSIDFYELLIGLLQRDARLEAEFSQTIYVFVF